MNSNDRYDGPHERDPDELDVAFTAARFLAIIQFEVRGNASALLSNYLKNVTVCTNSLRLPRLIEGVISDMWKHPRRRLGYGPKQGD